MVLHKPLLLGAACLLWRAVFASDGAIFLRVFCGFGGIVVIGECDDYQPLG
jgi:hypothetical protein